MQRISRFQMLAFCAAIGFAGAAFAEGVQTPRTPDRSVTPVPGRATSPPSDDGVSPEQYKIPIDYEFFSKSMCLTLFTNTIQRERICPDGSSVTDTEVCETEGSGEWPNCQQTTTCKITSKGECPPARTPPTVQSGDDGDGGDEDGDKVEDDANGDGNEGG